MLRGIISFKWGEIQDSYNTKIGRTKGASWSGNASRALLTFSQNMWNHRCEVLHKKMKSGLQDEGIRASSLTMALDLQLEPWRLLPSNQHLCARSLNFFTQAPMINVKQWKRRCEEALVLSGRNAIENGEDITKYFGRRCETSLDEVTESGCISEFNSKMSIEASQTRPVFDGCKVHEI